MSNSTMALLAYSLLAICAGWKFVNGRFEGLERPGILPFICKLILAYCIGLFYAVIWIITGLLRFISIMAL